VISSEQKIIFMETFSGKRRIVVCPNIAGRWLAQVRKLRELQAAER